MLPKFYSGEKPTIDPMKTSFYGRCDYLGRPVRFDIPFHPISSDSSVFDFSLDDDYDDE